MKDEKNSNGGYVSLAPYVTRFTLVYVLAAMGLLALIYKINLEVTVGLGLTLLIATVGAAAMKFGGEQGRTFTGGERWRMTLYSLLAALLITPLLLAGFSYLVEGPQGPQTWVTYVVDVFAKPRPQLTATIAIGVVLSLTVALYLAYWILGWFAQPRDTKNAKG